MSDCICNRYKIKLGLDINKTKNVLHEVTSLFDKIYSLFVNKVYNDGEHVGYLVRINAYDDDKYDTISYNDDVADAIVKAILECKDDYRVYFLQPSLEIMYHMYYNYTCKLASDVVKRFPEYIIDDVIQMCATVMVNLYNKGYYINKLVIRKALYNEVYAEHRINARQVSIAHIYSYDDSDDKLDIINDVRDVNADDRLEDKEHQETIDSMMAILRPIIISTIGERRFKNLMDNSIARSRSAQNNNDIKTLARAFKEYGYDAKWFNKFLGGNI